MATQTLPGVYWEGNMDNLILFAATNAVDSLDKEALQHIIQLIILCIPLLTLPLILKSSASVMGRVAGMAERFNSKALEPGLNKGVGGLKARASERARFTGANLYQRGLDSDRAGTGALNWAQNRRRASQAKRKARVDALDQRKHVRDADIASRARDRFAGDSSRAEALRRVAGIDGGTPRISLEAVKSAREEIDARFPSGDVTRLGEALQKAVAAGNNVEIRALTDRLGAEGGAGVNTIRDVIDGNHTGWTASSADMLNQAIKANYPDMKKAGADVANWNGQGATTFRGVELSDAEVVTMTAPAIERARTEGAVGAAQSQRIVDNPATNKDLTEAKRRALGF